MSEQDAEEINRLIGEFTDQQEEWERNRDSFDWRALQEIARKGAQAYNQDRGPSFHSLALDGVQHTEFHERFFTYLLQEGFDPFKLSNTETGALPVIDHAGLAESAASNAFSARIRSTLMDMARARFEPLAKDIESGAQSASSPLLAIATACAESIPDELMQRIVPEFTAFHGGGNVQENGVNPVEGYLSTAEAAVEKAWRPLG